MKTAILCLVLISIGALPPKPKFKHIDKYVPTYMGVKNLRPDEVDPVSVFLKDTLTKLGFKLIDNKKRTEFMKQLFSDFQSAAMNQIQSKSQSPSYRSKEEEALALYAKCVPFSSITIRYSAAGDPKTTLELCDSVGFAVSKLPPKTLTINYYPWHMWAITEIGSRSTDSVALFLLKNM